MESLQAPICPPHSLRRQGAVEGLREDARTGRLLCPTCGAALTYDHHDDGTAYFRCAFVERLRGHNVPTEDGSPRAPFVEIPLFP